MRDRDKASIGLAIHSIEPVGHGKFRVFLDCGHEYLCSFDIPIRLPLPCPRCQEEWVAEYRPEYDTDYP